MPSCGPCRVIKPIVEEIASYYDIVPFYINAATEEGKQQLSQFSEAAGMTPYILLLDSNGEPIASYITKEEVEEFLDEDIFWNDFEGDTEPQPKEREGSWLNDLLKVVATQITNKGNGNTQPRTTTNNNNNNRPSNNDNTTKIVIGAAILAFFGWLSGKNR